MRNLRMMRLEGIQIGDIVEVDRLGRFRVVERTKAVVDGCELSARCRCADAGREMLALR